MTTACTVCELHAESTFRVEGMDCHEEVAILERRLSRLSGLEALDADVLGQRLRIKYDASRLTTSAIAEAVAQTGMRAWLEHEAPVAAAGSGWRNQLVIGSGVLLATGLLLTVAVPTAPAWPAFLLSAILGGIPVGRRAIGSVRAGVLDINVLMVVAVLGAVALREWTEASSVVFLFALAQMLEARAMERARGAIRALMELSPTVAAVHRNGAVVQVPIDDVKVGDLVLVKPGEKVPLDGQVAAGDSHVNQAPVTGESLPVHKTLRHGGLRRHHQRPRRAGRRGHPPAGRLHHRAHHPPRRARAGAAGAKPDIRGPVRAHLHAHRAGAGRPGCRSATTRVRRRLGNLVLPLAGAARDFVPMRACDLDAGVDRVRARCRGPKGRADQRRRQARATGLGALRRFRQDRHSDEGAAPRRRACVVSRQHPRKRPSRRCRDRNEIGAPDRPGDPPQSGIGAPRGCRGDRISGDSRQGRRGGTRRSPGARRESPALRGSRAAVASTSRASRTTSPHADGRPSSWRSTAFQSGRWRSSTNRARRPANRSRCCAPTVSRRSRCSPVTTRLPPARWPRRSGSMMCGPISCRPTRPQR